MTAYLLLNHLLNFVAPAATVAILLVLMSRVFSRFLVSRRPLAQSLWAQAAIIFIVNVVVMGGGLMIFGNDGKMASYAAMVLAAGAGQWVMWRGWRA